ncbi:MAG: c-type cytochrome [Caldilineaceae bacterium]|nr:c-type cytochrome [Caldilineaceae bacterium]
MIPSETETKKRGVGRWRPALLFALLPTLAGLLWLALAGAPLQAQTPSPTFALEQVTPPTVPPAAAFGRGSYEQNCAPCHGLNGLGDGPTSASLPYSPTLFADPDAIWGLSPAEMFHTTKFGRIERLMPPWQNQLSDEQIWQTVMYAWSLHTEPAFVTGGQTLYAQNCAGCHGESGAGDGPDAPVDLPDFSDLTYAMTRSQEDWLAGWQAAHSEIGQGWTVDEQRQVLEYLRTFSYIPAWESGYKPGPGVLRGRVTQGTAGIDLPQGLAVTLEAYAQFTLAETFTTTVDAEGNFEFTNLAVDPTISYLASAVVEDVRYGSPIVNLTSEATEGETGITVYATTDEPGEIRIDRTDWIIDNEPGALAVVQLYFFGVSGDRTYTGSRVEGLDLPATVAIHIPPNAEQIFFENGVVGERFQQVGDLVYDTAPLIPGEGTKQLIVRYFLPYEGTSTTYSQRFLYPNAQTTLLVAELPQLQATITPSGAPAWQAADSQEFQGRSYQIYRGATLPATEIQVALSGLLGADALDPRGQTGTASIPTATFAPWMAWGVGGLSVLMLGGVVLWAWRSGRVQTAEQEHELRHEADELARRIAQLDDRYALGQLSADGWQQQRSQLKARLLELTLRLQAGETPHETH